MHSTFRVRWLASSEVISQGLFTSEQPEKNKMAFAAIFSQKKYGNSLRGTDNVQGQIFEHIFAPNGGYCVYYPSNLFRNVRIFWKLGNIKQLVYTTQVNSTFRARWLASSEVISQVLFTSEQPAKNKMAFVGILSQRMLLFGPLVIQLVWYILKQLFTSVSVNVVYIYLAALRLGEYPPLFTSTSVNNC